MSHWVTLGLLYSLIGVVLGECPNGWVVFDGSCYLFSHQQASFVDAQRHCAIQHGHLVNIESALENNFLKSFLMAEKNNFHWIGLNDLSIENVWVWEDTGEIASFTDWDNGQPEGGVVQNCVIMFFSRGYRWHDDRCSEIMNYICERSQHENVAIVG